MAIGGNWWALDLNGGHWIPLVDIKAKWWVPQAHAACQSRGVGT